jgi:hypothetical protein
MLGVNGASGSTSLQRIFGLATVNFAFPSFFAPTGLPPPARGFLIFR